MTALKDDVWQYSTNDLTLIKNIAPQQSGTDL